MEFSANDIYLTCVLQNYENAINLHMKRLSDYEHSIEGYEQDLKEFSVEEQQMNDEAKIIYGELQQLLVEMRRDAATLKRHINECQQKVERLKQL